MKYLLRLFVSGRSNHSERAVANLQKLCEEEMAGQYEIEVVDVLENSRLAEEDKILATPTLVRRQPTPVRKIIGDLSDRNRVLLGLDVAAGNRPTQAREEAGYD